MIAGIRHRNSAQEFGVGIRQATTSRTCMLQRETQQRRVTTYAWRDEDLIVKSKVQVNKTRIIEKGEH